MFINLLKKRKSTFISNLDIENASDPVPRRPPVLVQLHHLKEEAKLVLTTCTVSTFRNNCLMGLLT